MAIKSSAGDGEMTLLDAINAGVAAGFKKGYLRKSVVADPLRRIENEEF